MGQITLKIDRDYYNSHRISGYKPNCDEDLKRDLIYIDDILYNIIKKCTVMTEDNKFDYHLLTVEEIEQ